MKKRGKKKYFDLDTIQPLKELYIPELECYVKYGSLTYPELTKIAAENKTDETRTYAMLSMMLSKADNRFTVDRIKGLPIKVFLALLRAISKQENLQHELKTLQQEAKFYT